MLCDSAVFRRRAGTVDGRNDLVAIARSRHGTDVAAADGDFTGGWGVRNIRGVGSLGWGVRGAEKRLGTRGQLRSKVRFAVVAFHESYGPFF